MKNPPRSFTRFLKSVALLVVLQLSVNAFPQMRQVYFDPSNPAENEIYKISFFSPAQGYVGLRDWIGYTVDSGRTFIRKYITLANVNYNGYSVNLTFGFFVSGIKAFDQNNIIVYGHYGLVPSILRSTDGGNTFTLVFHSRFDPNALRTGIRDVVFPQNGNTGYAVDADRILKTVDKGSSWTAVRTDAGRYFDYLEATDDQNVFAFSTDGNTGALFKTVNAGSSWTLVPTPAGRLQYAAFFSAAKGWLNVVDNNVGKIYYTANGGSSWTQKNHNSATPFSTGKMKFINDSTGFALAGLYGVYKTSDSGKVWEKIPRDNDFMHAYYTHNDLQLLNPTQLWAGGGGGFLELNTNAGAKPLPGAFFRIDTSGVAATNTVNLLNHSKPGYQYRWFVNGTQVSTAYNAYYTHEVFRYADTVQLIVSNGASADTAIKHQFFKAIPYPAPVVSSYAPQAGGPGTVVTISGNFFGGVSGVSFGGIPAASFTVASLTSISAVVGAGGNGSVAVTTLAGTGSLPGFITVPPPVITSFAPASGAIGTPVIVQGANFSAVAAENTVYFGPVKAVVNAASANQLTVLAPAGATLAPISITVNKHTAYSTGRFNLTFPSPCGFTEGSFDPAKSFGTGDASTYDLGGMAVSDLDGDGKNDLAITTRSGISLLRNTGQRGYINFASALNLPAGLLPGSVAVGDLDGDGKPDLVVTSSVDTTVSVFRNGSQSGSFSFVQKFVFKSPGTPTDVAVGDIDADGKPDVVVANAGNSNTVSVFRNISVNGTVAFAPRTDFTTGRSPSHVRIGDIDGDGKPDLFVEAASLVSGNGIYGFSVLRNNGQMGIVSFDTVRIIPYNTYADVNSDVNDVDGDGKVDVIIAYDTRYATGTPASIATFRNTSTPGAIGFAAATGTPGCPYNKTISLADLDGDNKPDLFSSCWASGNFKLLRNTGSVGAVAFSSVGFPSIVNPGGFDRTLIADLDGDGRPDLIGANNSSGSVSVLRNRLNESHGLAGEDTAICSGQTVVLGVSNAEGHTYSWTSNPTGVVSAVARPVVSPSVPTVYYLAVTNPQGCVMYDTVRINVGATAPIADAGPDKQVCKGRQVQIGTAAAANNTYAWTSLPAGFTSTTANPVFTSDTTRAYFLTVKNETCSAKDTVQVVVNNYPPANAGPDTSVCVGSGIRIGTAASGPNTYSWASSPAGFSSSAANPFVYPAVTTDYFLTVTGTGGCSVSDTTHVVANPSPPVPVITPSGTVALCTGDSVTLATTATGNNAWKRGGTTIGTGQTVVAKLDGNYYSVVSNGVCTATSIPVYVTVNPPASAPVIWAGGPAAFCFGDNVTLFANQDQGNRWYKDGIAISGATGGNYVVTQGGVYTAKSGANSCLSAASNAITVSVASTAPAPTVTALGPTALCAGSNVVLNSSATAGNQWYKDGTAIASATAQTYTAMQAGGYTVIVTNGTCNSPVSNVIPVSVAAVPAPPSITASGPTNFCTGSNVVLTASVTAGLQWYKDGTLISGATAATYPASASGSYTAKTGNGSCTSAASNQIVVIVSPAPTTPVITASGPLAFCTGGKVQFVSSADTGNQWYKNAAAIAGAVNKSYQATQAGSYTVKVSSGGCVSNASVATIVNVTAVPSAPVITQAGNVLNSSGTNGNQWYFNGVAIAGATSVTYTASASGNYTVTVTVNGCTSEASAVVNFVLTAISSPSLNAIVTVAPNPVSDHLLVRYNGNPADFVLEIKDATGKRIVADYRFASRCEIDMSRFAAGIYSVQIINRRTGEQVVRTVLKK